MVRTSADEHAGRPSHGGAGAAADPGGRHVRWRRYGARRCRVLLIMFLAAAFLGLLGSVSLTFAMLAAQLGYYTTLVARALVVGVASLLLAGLLVWIVGASGFAGPEGSGITPSTVTAVTATACG